MTYNGEKRKIKAQYTKQKIYESAKELFASEHYNDISVDSIVKKAGVSKGSFYVHYASKEALVNFLIEDYVAKIDTDYINFIHTFPKETPTEELFLSLIAKITDLLMDIGFDKIQALYQGQITKNLDTETVTSHNREIYKMFSRLLERGIERGEFKTDMPLNILTKHLMMAMRGITYEWCIRYPNFDYKTEALTHFRLLLKGLRERNTIHEFK